jgi:hypothetical protein
MAGGMLMYVVIISGSLSPEAQAGWPRIGGVAGNMGSKISNVWKGTAGESWNRAVRDPWQAKVYNPVVADPYRRASSKFEKDKNETRARIQELERRAYEEARRRWNDAYDSFASQIKQHAWNNARQLGIRNMNEFNQYVEAKKQEWIRANPFPELQASN